MSNYTVLRIPVKLQPQHTKSPKQIKLEDLLKNYYSNSIDDLLTFVLKRPCKSNNARHLKNDKPNDLINYEKYLFNWSVNMKLTKLTDDKTKVYLAIVGNTILFYYYNK